MATETVSLTSYESHGGVQKLDLRELVREATWKDVLMELVDTKKLDPWDVDLSGVIEAYVAAVRQMKVLDLHVPANIILAAAVLLRMKSDAFTIFEIAQQEIPEEIVSTARVMPEVPQLTQKIRMQPGKRITLMELMHALDEAIKVKEKRTALLESSIQEMHISIPNEDIDEKIKAALEMVRQNVDSTGLTTFSALAAKLSEPGALISDLFVPLLFLSHRESVILVQEKFFDEIFVKFNFGKGENGA